ncbi:hypothetical protein GGS21DRAFT_544538 [Xylaria nigripes]|nr:hypothetical protein GGS21DRAFT_544538 [Xylaria nigripes]
MASMRPVSPVFRVGFNDQSQPNTRTDSKMDKSGSPGKGAPTDGYHRHPLFLDLPLAEAIQRGLAIPVKSGENNNDEHEATEMDNQVQNHPGLHGPAPVPASARIKRRPRPYIENGVPESTQQLRDRLGLHGPAAVPPPLRIRHNVPNGPRMPFNTARNNDVGLHHQIYDTMHAPSPQGASPFFDGSSPHVTKLQGGKPHVPHFEPQPPREFEVKRRDYGLYVSPGASSVYSPIVSRGVGNSPLVHRTATHPLGVIGASSKASAPPTTPTVSLFPKPITAKTIDLKAMKQQREGPDMASQPGVFRKDLPLHPRRTDSETKTMAVNQTPDKKLAAQKSPNKAGKDQGTSENSPRTSISSLNSEQRVLEADILDLLDQMGGIGGSNPPPRPPPKHAPPPPPQPRSNEQVNNSPDTDDSGWMASHRRAHRLAAEQRLNGISSTIPTTPTRAPGSAATYNALNRAKFQLTRMANEAEAEASEKASMSGPASSIPTRSSTTRGIESPLGSASYRGSGGSSYGRPPKPSFLERCGKVLTKKRSFWKKDE